MSKKTKYAKMGDVYFKLKITKKEAICGDCKCYDQCPEILDSLFGKGREFCIDGHYYKAKEYKAKGRTIVQMADKFGIGVGDIVEINEDGTKI